MTIRSTLAATLCAIALSGCGAGNETVAVQNRTFYANEFVSGVDVTLFEKRYPPLDAAKLENTAPFEGYEILGSAVAISRPTNWKIRAASASPSGRYIVYTSPRQYLFAIYEQIDPPGAGWSEVLKRYETDVSATAKILEGAVPFATADAQGRAYVIQRVVAAARTPFINTSREIVLRNEHRVVLMQVVYAGEVLPELSPELMHVFQTLRMR
jgi:hypothetical protein